jgi:hypothetical protein
MESAPPAGPSGCVQLGTGWVGAIRGSQGYLHTWKFEKNGRSPTHGSRFGLTEAAQTTLSARPNAITRDFLERYTRKRPNYGHYLNERTPRQVLRVRSDGFTGWATCLTRSVTL